MSVNAAHTLLAAYCVCLCPDKQEEKAISHWGAIKHCLIYLPCAAELRAAAQIHQGALTLPNICIKSFVDLYLLIWEPLTDRSSELVSGYTVTSVEFQVARRILMNFLWLVEEVDGCADTAYDLLHSLCPQSTALKSESECLYVRAFMNLKLNIDFRIQIIWPTFIFELRRAAMLWAYFLHQRDWLMFSRYNVYNAILVKHVSMLILAN